MTKESISQQALDVIAQEMDALATLRDTFNGEMFTQVVQAVEKCEGNVVLSGLGKPYFIAQKVAASLASTGTPAIAMHPVDAVHGDMGRVRPGDVVILLSNSGATLEMLTFARALDSVGVVRVGVSRSADCPLARLCDHMLALGVIGEADALGLAPTSSTLAMLALGDALMVVLARRRGFDSASFANLHPGGQLGRRVCRVADLKRPLERSAVVAEGALLRDVLQRITEKRTGAALVVDAKGRLRGIFTDGDLRRTLSEHPDCLDHAVVQHMSENPRTISLNAQGGEALKMMRAHQIDELPVVDDEGHLAGHIDIQDVG
jgi:arabinose-5-phosphate isomerase